MKHMTNKQIYELPMNQKPSPSDAKSLLENRPKMKPFSVLWSLVRAILRKEFEK